MYRPTSIPETYDRQWLERELRSIAESQTAAVDGVVYNTLYAAPKRIYDGLTVKADGTTWNPGSGAGCYQYRGGAWRFLG